MVRVVLYGATGEIGRRIAKEATSRRHEVSGVVRNVESAEGVSGIELVQGDMSDPTDVAGLVSGADVVVSAVRQAPGEPADALVRAARGLIEGLTAADVKRFLWVGGAGSLLMPSGEEFLDTVDPATVPAEALVSPRSQVEAKAVIEAEAGELEWTYLSPSLKIEPGERTGEFRVGEDEMLFDESGQSRISMEDYAVALVDELERPRHQRRRFTVGY